MNLSYYSEEACFPGMEERDLTLVCKLPDNSVIIKMFIGDVFQKKKLIEFRNKLQEEKKKATLFTASGSVAFSAKKDRIWVGGSPIFTLDRKKYSGRLMEIMDEIIRSNEYFENSDKSSDEYFENSDESSED